MEPKKNPAAVKLGKLAGKKRLETGGIKAMRDMAKKGAAARNANKQPTEFYKEMRRKSGEAKLAKKLAKA